MLVFWCVCECVCACEARGGEEDVEVSRYRKCSEDGSLGGREDRLECTWPCEKLVELVVA